MFDNEYDLSNSSDGLLLKLVAEAGEYMLERFIFN